MVDVWLIGFNGFLFIESRGLAFFFKCLNNDVSGGFAAIGAIPYNIREDSL